jgi:hypothetical protein
MSIAHHVYTAVDCANPVSLARFYAEITGWDVGEIEDLEDEWVDLFHKGVRMMAFQKVSNYNACGKTLLALRIKAQRNGSKSNWLSISLRV